MKIAIFPSAGLGDGIVQLLLAQNLARLGIGVDYYHHFLADMNNYIQHVNVRRPSRELVSSQIACYHLLLADSGSKGLKVSEFGLPVKHKLATYTMGRIAPYSIKKKQRFYSASFISPSYRVNDKTIDFNCFNGKSLRSNRFLGLSTAEHIVRFLKTNNLVDEPQYTLDLSLPDDWVKQKHATRILIHPTSAGEDKNWLAQRYIDLAQRLKEQGFRPVFSMSPAEKLQWRTIINGQFEIPCFEDISDLGRYYYESAMLIGTDSGNGHLASALGLPTITLVNLRSRKFTWRPNWSTNTIVKPLLSRKLVGKHFWKYTLSLNSVLKAFNRLKMEQGLVAEPSRPKNTNYYTQLHKSS